MSYNKPWIIGFCFYIRLIITIAISAYLQFLPAKNYTIPFKETIRHFILIQVAGFLVHLT